MANDERKGQTKQAVGKVKKFAGRVTGDEDTEAPGRAEQGEGKIKGGTKDIADKIRGK